MVWIKSLHIVFMVSWFAGLFYLPRLYVYHAMASGEPAATQHFKVMERKLYRGIMTPTMLLTVATGLWLWFGYGFGGRWLDAKVALVVVLVAYHLWMGRLRRDFERDANRRSHVFYRWVNEIPLILLLAIVFLVVAKPF